jgi:hypothetical protein
MYLLDFIFFVPCGGITNMISLSEDKSCLRRSVYAGLKYAGIEDKCNWLPLAAYEEELQRVVDRYPLLELKDKYSFAGEAVPLLVVYETSTIDEFGLSVYHAVFVSDSLPFSNEEGHFKVKHMILGWEKLAKHPLKLRWFKYKGMFRDAYKKYMPKVQSYITLYKGKGGIFCFF